MKKSLFLIILMLTSLTSFGLVRNEECINLHYKGKPHGHFELPVPAIEPDVYYDSEAQIIIVEGTGNVSYYDVEITALSTFDVPISTRIDGTYDTIDISSLPSDDYVITINTPMEISYQSKFTII